MTMKTMRRKMRTEKRRRRKRMRQSRMMMMTTTKMTIKGMRTTKKTMRKNLQVWQDMSFQFLETTDDLSSSLFLSQEAEKLVSRFVKDMSVRCSSRTDASAAELCIGTIKCTPLFFFPCLSENQMSFTHFKPPSPFVLQLRVSAHHRALSSPKTDLCELLKNQI